MLVTGFGLSVAGASAVKRPFFDARSWGRSPGDVAIGAEIRVLVVDDNTAVREDFQRILCTPTSGESDLDRLSVGLFGGDGSSGSRMQRYEVETVDRGEAAVPVVQRASLASRSFDVAFVDMRMPPGWNGVETMIHLLRIDAHLQCVLCTAYSDFRWDEVVAQLGSNQNLHLLRKPFAPEHVRRMADVLGVKAQRLRA